MGGCAAPKSERISSRHALHDLVRVRARGRVRVKVGFEVRVRDRI